MIELFRRKPQFTLSNMDKIQKPCDDKIWAEWFQFVSWTAIKSGGKDLNMKTKIDFMANERMMGTSFDDALRAYGKWEFFLCLRDKLLRVYQHCRAKLTRNYNRLIHPKKITSDENDNTTNNLEKE